MKVAAHAMKHWPRPAAVCGAGDGWHAHDLLLLREPLRFADGPPWLAAAIAKAPLAVVRRAHCPAGSVAIGFRGKERAQRYGTEIAHDAVLAAISPEDLLGPAFPQSDSQVPALQLLAQLRPVFAQFGLSWGPTGSVGFELASGLPTASAGSDLDLMVRCPQALPRAQAAALLHELAMPATLLACRLDVQLETPAGAVALAEYAHGGLMLLRSGSGPRLTSDPWHEPLAARDRFPRIDRSPR